MREPLGRPEKKFSLPGLGLGDLFGWFLLSLLPALGFLCFGLYRFFLGINRYGAAAGPSWSRGWIVLAAAWLVIPILLAFRKVRASRRIIFVHQFGLRLAGGGKPQRILWKEVDALLVDSRRYNLFGIPLTQRWRLELKSPSGVGLKLPAHERTVEDLLAVLREKIYPRIQGEYRAGFEAGQWLNFGPLRVNREFLARGKESLGLKQITSVQVESGELLINAKARKPWRLACAEVPNLELLLELVAQASIS